VKKGREKGENEKEKARNGKTTGKWKLKGKYIEKR
jgi:hypothetical protein